jgi:hypothetical protein
MITQEQITRLEQQGCTAEDWSQVTLVDPPSIPYIHDVTFQGKVKVSRLSGTVSYGGFTKHAQLRRVTLNNVTVGVNCYICDVHQGISNYTIGRGAYIENVGSIVMPEPSTFGSGVQVSVLPETGGREVTLHPHLSSQEAYLQAYLATDEEFMEYYEPWLKQRIEDEKAKVGSIGERCVVVNTQRLQCVRLEKETVVEGATLLENCGFYGPKIRIGAGVTVKDAVVVAGATISDGATLTRCYVGSGTVVTHGFTATDCVFASNCHFENGEACAVLAGPYTVSHHKSTLLIGCNFSFYNAGSGTNQSNHAYKLGAHHAGVLQRGCKTASSSHMLLPVHVGAFSMVMGHHKAHFDTTAFPFSYIIEEEGREYLIPGVAATSIGLYRDRAKWPLRDKRVECEYSTDIITYQMFTPFTIDRIIDAVSVLEGYLKKPNFDRTYRGLHLTDRACRKGLQNYIAVVSSYFAALINKNFPKGLDAYTDFEIKEKLNCENYDIEELPEGDDEVYMGHRMHVSDYVIPDKEDEVPWRDFGGIIFPEEGFRRFKHELFFNDKRREPIDYVVSYWWDPTIRAVNDLEWIWACRRVLRRCTREELKSVVREGEDKFKFLREKIYKDGLKEFEGDAHLVGYGVCGAGDPGVVTPEEDFKNVRGTAEQNEFMQHIMAANNLFDLDPRVETKPMEEE